MKTKLVVLTLVSILMLALSVAAKPTLKPPDGVWGFHIDHAGNWDAITDFWWNGVYYEADNGYVIRWNAPSLVWELAPRIDVPTIYENTGELPFVDLFYSLNENDDQSNPRATVIYYHKRHGHDREL